MKNGSGFFINFYDDKEWWPDNIYSNENQTTNEGYFSFGESKPIPIKEKSQNDLTSAVTENNDIVGQTGKIIDYLPIYDAIFKLYSEKNKKWIWSDSDLFDIRYELFKVRDSMITDWWVQDNYGNSHELEYNYFYLWFVQTGTKVVYEPKTTTDNVPNYPPISNEDPSQWPENWFDQWSNFWNKKYVISNDSTVKFLGLTQDDYTSGLEKGDVWSTHIEPKVIDKGNTKNIEYTPYYSKEPIKNADKTPPKKEDYNFEQGMAFFIKIPKWCSFVVENQNVTESEDDVIGLKTLFEWFKTPPSIDNGISGSGSGDGNLGGEIETPNPEPSPEQPELTPTPEPDPIPPTDGDNNSGNENTDENKPEIDTGGSQQPISPPVIEPEQPIIPPTNGDGETINPIDPPENGDNNDSNSGDNNIGNGDQPIIPNPKPDLDQNPNTSPDTQTPSTDSNNSSNGNINQNKPEIGGNDSNDSKNNNLTNNNQNSNVGIIIGITIGVGLLFSLISLCWFVKKKNNKKDRN